MYFQIKFNKFHQRLEYLNMYENDEQSSLKKISKEFNNKKIKKVLILEHSFV